MSTNNIQKTIVYDGDNNKSLKQFSDTKNLRITDWGNYSNVKDLDFSYEEGKILLEKLKELYDETKSI